VPGSSDPACIKNDNINNLIDCVENASDPGCLVDQDQEERENLCEEMPGNPICQTLNIVPGTHKMECSSESSDPICRLAVAKQRHPTEKPCKPGSSDPRCARKPLVKKQKTKPFVNLGNPRQLPKIKQLKKERDPKVFFEIPSKNDKPAKNNPKRLRKPLKPEKPVKILNPKFKPFTAFRKPVDPNDFPGVKKNKNKDPSKAVGQQVPAKVPEDNKSSFKTPPVVRLKPTENQDAKPRSKDPKLKVQKQQTRKPKEFDDSEEPVGEPEPGSDYHSPGSNPRTHAFHSWLYQKIDPKVRAARRKKFFGTGRKKRQIPDELFDKIYSIDTDEVEENEAKETEGSDPSYHAFHLWQRQKVDKTKSSRRRKMLREGRSFALLRQKPHSIAKRDSNSEKISINLGVKRITIDDSLLDILPPETQRRTVVEEKRQESETQREVKYIMVPNSSVALAFCMFVMIFFLALSVIFSTVFRHKRYVIRKL